MLITQVQKSARAVCQNNASGKGRQRTPRVNSKSKYGSPNLLHGPGMYSKLVSETEQPRRDLENTKVGKAVYVCEVIRFVTARECGNAADSSTY